MLRALCKQDSVLLTAVESFVESKLWWRLAGVVLSTVLLVFTADVLLGVGGWVRLLEPSGASFALAQRAIAFANLAGFCSYWPQVLGLVGSRGLDPAARVMERVRRRADRDGDSTLARFLAFPTLFWLSAADGALRGVCALGAAVSLLLLAGPVVGTLWAPPLWAAAGLCYLSLLLVSGDFLGLQSDSNLPEVDWLLSLLSVIALGHPESALLVLRFFAWRKMLACGICKYHGSPMWRALTAMKVHYYTQPLPNPVSRYMHWLPAEMHALSVLATLWLEIPWTFLCWGTRPLRLGALLGFTALNGMINLSGNYGFIGLLNMCENLSLLDDRMLSWLSFGALAAEPGPPAAPLPFLVRAPAWALATLYCLLSVLPLQRSAKGQVGFPELWGFPIEAVDRALRASRRLRRRSVGPPGQQPQSAEESSEAAGDSDAPGGLRAHAYRAVDRLEKFLYVANAWQRPFRMVNYQGKFSGMHDFRWEPVIEGLSVEDAQAGRSKDPAAWKRYRWRYKPTDEETRPAVAPLHLPRLDWRIWFLPLAARRGRGAATSPEWFHELLRALLAGGAARPEVLALLAGDPFGGAAPAAVRCRLESFEFAPLQDTGRWWRATPVPRQQAGDMDCRLRA
eukprot:TRINITY_DN16014_c0_g1_i2.p2 TRINITY_DN16014_c0_g1~~TRINITY_DN16014_c0_g1_i2.p2  ORF type:complete len:651 (+),score=237.40 TRINITY_DN16014_c0_g1_i2:82-1953(+)